METKICSKCEDNKSILDFHKNNRKPDGRQSWCKECNKQSIIDGYKINPKIYKDRAFRNKQKKQKLMIEYLQTHPCVDCGESDPIVLDFDHQNDKKFNVSKMVSQSNSWENILREIAKCVVRCSNCHRRKTAKQMEYYKYKMLYPAMV